MQNGITPATTKTKRLETLTAATCASPTLMENGTSASRGSSLSQSFTDPWVDRFFDDLKLVFLPFDVSSSARPERNEN